MVNSVKVTYFWHALLEYLIQGTLTEGKGLVLLASSLR